MGWIQIDTRPTRRQQIVFGLTWLVFFSAVGLLVWYQARSPAASIALWALAVLIPAAGCFVRGFLRIVYVAVSYATFPIGYAVSFLILATIYYLVVTPTGLIMRLFRRDPMRRRFEQDLQTYWVVRPQRDDLQSYLRQF